MKVTRIVLKDLKILLRSKSSAAIIILGPLLIMLFAGVAFNTTLGEKVNVAVYSPEYNNLTNSFIKSLTEGGEVKVEKLASKESCIESTKTGLMHACLVFPKNFSVEQEGAETIDVYIDYSKINLVRIVLNKISERIENQSSALSEELTVVLLNNLELTSQEMTSIARLLTNLQTDNSLIKQQITNSETSLVSVDLSFDENEFQADELETATREMSYYTESIKNMGQGAITTTEENYDLIWDEVNGSSVQTSVRNIISDARDTLWNRSGEINTEYSYFEEQETNANTITDIIQDGLGDVDTRLTDIEQSRTTFTQNAKVMKDTLTSSEQNLKDMSKSKNRVLQSISNIKVTEAGDIVSPVQTSIQRVTPENGTRLNYMFPSLIVLIIMFISVLFSTTSVVMEKNSSAYFRNFLAPTKRYVFILGSYLTNIILLTFQSLLVLLIAWGVFKAPIFKSLHLILLVMFLLASLFILIGIFLGSLFRTEETGILGAISVGSIFLLLSDFILPLESMSQTIQGIARFNPFIIGSDLLRKTLLFGYELPDLQQGILLLLGYCAVFLILIMIVEQLTKARIFEKSYKLFSSKSKGKKYHQVKKIK